MIWESLRRIRRPWWVLNPLRTAIRVRQSFRRIQRPWVGRGDPEYIESQEKESQRDDEFKIGTWHQITLQPACSRLATYRPQAVVVEYFDNLLTFSRYKRKQIDMGRMHGNDEQPLGKYEKNLLFLNSPFRLKERQVFCDNARSIQLFLLSFPISNFSCFKRSTRFILNIEFCINLEPILHAFPLLRMTT
jgi:hypothetical protein